MMMMIMMMVLGLQIQRTKTGDEDRRPHKPEQRWGTSEKKSSISSETNSHKAGVPRAVHTSTGPPGDFKAQLEEHDNGNLS